ncbi:MAG: UDP-3-O-(3-hydroxymyristoyl)glucosamine N-acyltransferase [Chthoniobacterales bacterium]|nr:UDP-3-O-(3-hydroxymyristoyl)glucosamine N-acyltransferase [Chthoniobacterales bacterium]
MRLEQIADLIEGEVVTPSEVEITGIACLRNAGPSDLAFYASQRYWKELCATEAGAVLVPSDFQETAPCPIIKVKDPSAAFDLIVARLAPKPISPSPGVHPQAVVASSAILGEEVAIGPFVVIEEGAVIGDRSVIGAHGFIGAHTVIGKECLFHPRVTVRERCTIGDRVILHPGVVIGSCGFGYIFRNGEHQKIPQAGSVHIEEDVEIGANTTIDRARFGKTIIGKGTKIDNLVQIAHNVVIGAHNIICAQVGISGSTRTGKGVTLAGQVGLSGHIEIGDGAIIAAQSGISKDVAPNSLLVGSPGKPIDQWKKNNFYYQRLPQLSERLKALEKKLL